MEVICPRCNEKTTYDWTMHDAQRSKKFSLEMVQFTLTCQRCDLPFEVIVQIFEQDNKETVRKRIIEYVG
ncbi:MAG: hypothetical protein ABIH34_07050 [Nanoarchaeota archaeon]